MTNYIREPAVRHSSGIIQAGRYWIEPMYGAVHGRVTDTVQDDIVYAAEQRCEEPVYRTVLPVRTTVQQGAENSLA